jgi:hypothetical protein
MNELTCFIKKHAEKLTKKEIKIAYLMQKFNGKADVGLKLIEFDNPITLTSGGDALDLLWLLRLENWVVDLEEPFKALKAFIKNKETAQRKPYEVDDHGELALEFKEPPELNGRADAMYLLDKLIEADRTENEGVALKALRDAINKGVLNQ